MEKSMKFKLFNAYFEIKILPLLIITAIYSVGVIIGCFLKIEISDKLFSPLLIFYFGTNTLAIFVHSFLYFLLFPIIVFFFANSKYGFIPIPILILIKGIFVAFSIIKLIDYINLVELFLIYGIILSVEIILFLIYSLHSIEISYSLMKNKTEDNISYDIVVISIFLVLSLITALIQIKL